MRKIATILMAVLISFSVEAQWTGWGTGFLNMPNQQAGRFYIGVTNVSAGSNVVLYYNPVSKTIVINSTSGGGGGGTNGVNGTNATVTVGSTTTLAPGSPATVVNVGTSLAAILDFGIPAGATGATGPEGPPGTNASPVQVFSTSDSDPNSAAITPEDPTKGAIFYQDSSITLYNEWKWSVVSQTWYQTISP